MFEFTVFLCGAITMILEIVNTRILAPYFGTSTIVWTNIISVVLGSLSLGYYLGGKLADKKLGQTTLAAILFLSGLLSVIVFAVNGFVSQLILTTFHDIRIGSLLASIILFAPLNVCLGIVTPYIVRLRITHISTSGGTVGNLYALSTLGSIVGTLSVSFFLLPYIGSQGIYTLCALILIGLSFLISKKRHLLPRLLLSLIAIGIVISSFRIKTSMKKVLKDIDTQYNRVFIFDTTFLGKPARIMGSGRFAISAMFLNSKEYAHPYYKYFDYAKQNVPRMNNALMIGGGGFTYAKRFMELFPNAQLDIVEIDPGLTQLAKEDFGFIQNKQIKIIHQDGRVFLNETKNKYDAIFIDAFNDQVVPFQLTTAQAINRLSSILSPDGMIALNLISSLEGDMADFAVNEVATYQDIFPVVKLYAVKDAHDRLTAQNFVLIAQKQTGFRTPLPGEVFVHEKGRILTDDYAPVEYYTLDYYR